MSTVLDDGEPGLLRWWWLAALLAALLPFIGTLDAGLISDDGAALAWVHRHGPLADWTSSEYDLHTVRFWRPLVTTTLGLQEAWTGVAAGPLRAFNVLCHAATALLAGALALRLGGGRAGALVAGLLAALFPYAGGTVVWIVGRVDSQCAPLLLGALCLALDGAFVGALLVAVLALATKEIAFVLPFWGVLLALGRGDPWRRALRSALPLALALALALLARRAALGQWLGGYPLPALDWTAAPNACIALARELWPLAAVVLLALGFALTRAREHARVVLACGACMLVAAVPLVHVLHGGSVAPEQRRTLLVPALALALAAGARVGPLCAGFSAARVRQAALFVGVPALCALAWFARGDVQTWATAGRDAERWVADRRTELAGIAADTTPALRADAPRLDASGRAYVLHWGVADRFREPFPRTTRELWPWRPLFDGAETAREWRRGSEADVLLPERAGAAPELEVRLYDGEREETRLYLDERLWIEPGRTLAPPPRIEIHGAGPTWIEAVLVTDLGYQAAPIAAFAVPPTHGRATASLRDVLMAPVGSGGILLWQALAQSADLGATRAFLELRRHTAPKLAQSGGAPQAISRWIPLEWSPALRDRMLE
jgi:hypothetical protein